VFVLQPPRCVVRLSNMVQRDELLDEEEYQDIVEETSEEVSKYGKLKKVRRHHTDGCVCTA
jgi:hypothetical protein